MNLYELFNLYDIYIYVNLYTLLIKQTVCVSIFLFALMLLSYFIKKKQRFNLGLLYFMCAWECVLWDVVLHSSYVWLSPCFYFSKPPSPKHAHPPVWMLAPAVCVCVCAYACVCVPVLHYKDSCLFSVACFIPKLAALDSSVQHILYDTYTNTHTHSRTQESLVSRGLNTLWTCFAHLSAFIRAETQPNSA